MFERFLREFPTCLIAPMQWDEPEGTKGMRAHATQGMLFALEA